MNKKKFSILIVDDLEINRDLLNDLLKDSYKIYQAYDGKIAWDLIQNKKVDLILLDYIMPEYDGLWLLNTLKSSGEYKHIPVIMITADLNEETVYKSFRAGATDFVQKPFSETLLKSRIKNILLLNSKQKELVEEVTNKVYNAVNNNKMLVNILSHIVEFRNQESGLHILRVNVLTRIFLNELLTITDKYKLSTDDVDNIILASSLHDIGKMGIWEEVLNKPEKLTPAEFNLMKTHTTIGARLLEKIDYYQDEPLMKYSINICKYHHEKWDGKGYPSGLKEDEIPIEAQIVSLADVYDALTSERCYKKAYDHDTAIKMILNKGCGEFNPLLIQVLLNTEQKIKEKIPEYNLYRASKSEIKKIISDTLYM